MRMLKAKANLPEVAACLAIAAAGLFAIWFGLDYRLGSLTRMGPGFFPLMLGVLVVALAIASAVESARHDGKQEGFKLRPLVFVSLGMLAWTYMVEPFGIVAATLALIALSALARPGFRPLAVLSLTAGLALCGYLVFIAGLGMPLTLFGR